MANPGRDGGWSGGCRCGALRWESEAAPLFQGLCYCADCRKASGSGFVPFMAFSADALVIAGEALQVRSPAWGGREAVRNHCALCSSLVFGGERGKDSQHTVYAGSLDDPARFRPTLAIFCRDRPQWALLPEGLDCFEVMPG